MAIDLGILPTGFEGPNAIRKMFGMMASLRSDAISFNASIGVPGVPSREIEEYVQSQSPNYTQTPGGEEFQREAASYFTQSLGAECSWQNVMATPQKIGAFSHLIRSTIVRGSKAKVYLDSNLNPEMRSFYQKIIEMQGGEVVDFLDSSNPPVIAVYDDMNPNIDSLDDLRNCPNTLIFADGIFGDEKPAIISRDQDFQDRLITHRHIPSYDIEGEKLFPDIGIIHTSVKLQRDGFEQPLHQRLCAAQEHAQTCLPDVCLKDGALVLRSNPQQRKAIEAKRDSQALQFIAAEFNRYTSGADKENVMLSYGGTGVLFNFVHGCLDAEDRIGIFDPYFAAYNGPFSEKAVEAIKIGLAGGRPNLANFKEQVGSLKAVLINNPTNPSGLVWTKDELNEIIAILANSQCMVFLDDTYRELVFSDDGTPEKSTPFMTALEEKINLAKGEEREKLEELKNRCVVQISTAKEIGGDPAKRCGMAYVPNPEMLQKMQEVQENSTRDVATHMDQYVTSALRRRAHQIAVYGADDWTKEACSTYGKRGVVAKELCSKIEIDGEEKQIFEMVANPRGGFFMMVKLTEEFRHQFYGKRIPDDFQSDLLREGLNLPQGVAGKVIETDADVASYLMLKSGIVMVPGSGFGFPEKDGTFRVAFARLDEKVNVKEILTEIAHAAKELQNVQTQVQPQVFRALQQAQQQQLAAENG